VAIVFILSIISLVSLWGVDWFSSLCLFVYILVCTYFLFSLTVLPFEGALSETGLIDVKQPIVFTGQISARSFYNKWVLFLCVEESESLLFDGDLKHNKPRKWFVVFNDSVKEEEYRLIARLIVNARWA